MHSMIPDNKNSINCEQDRMTSHIPNENTCHTKTKSCKWRQRYI